MFSAKIKLYITGKQTEDGDSTTHEGKFMVPVYIIQCTCMHINQCRLYQELVAEVPITTSCLYSRALSGKVNR